MGRKDDEQEYGLTLAERCAIMRAIDTTIRREMALSEDSDFLDSAWSLFLKLGVSVSSYTYDKIKKVKPDGPQG